MFILSARRDLGFAGLSRHGAPAGSCGLSARLLSARFSMISSEHVQIEGDACGTWPALASCERKRRQQVHLSGVAGLRQVRGGHGHQWSCRRHWQQVWGINIITDAVFDAREAPPSVSSLTLLQDIWYPPPILLYKLLGLLFSTSRKKAERSTALSSGEYRTREERKWFF